MAKKLNKLFKSRDFWVGVLIVVLGVSTGFFKDLFKPAGTAYLEIRNGSNRRAFRGDLPYEMTVLDALNASSQAGSFRISYAVKDGRTGIFSINGEDETSENGQKWNFYLNGRKIETAQIHKTRIKAGDKILVKLE